MNETTEAQAAIAYLLGRAIAAEKAIQTLIASRSQDDVKLADLMRANLDLRAGYLAQDFEAHGVPASFLPAAQQAFLAQQKAVLKAISSGRYVVPDVRQPHG